MPWESVSKKKQIFQTEIRRKHRNDLFKKLRKDVITSQEVKQALASFCESQPPEIPIICQEQFPYIEKDYLRPFLQLVMNNQLHYLRESKPPKTNAWFFDCVSVGNLKFMTAFCQQDTQHILAGYFHATIQAHRPFYDFYLHLSNQIKKNGCLINSLKSESQQELEEVQDGLKKFMESQEGARSITAALQFWGTYIEYTQDSILVEHFTIMLKLFQLFAEYSSIFVSSGTFKFISGINHYILKMNILDQKGKNLMNTFILASDCKTYLQQLKVRMPFILRKAVDYRLFIYQVASILISSYKMNPFFPGNFFLESIRLCEHLLSLILGLLQTEEDSYRCRVSALKIINYFSGSQNLFRYFYLEGALNIVHTLAHKLLFEEVQQESSIVLYNIISDDHDQRNFSKIIQHIDFQELLSTLPQQRSKQVYELLLKILSVYNRNKAIYNSLLLECDLEETLRMYCRGKEDQECYEQLVCLVMSNQDFMFGSYQIVVQQMYDHVEEMNFEGIQGFRKKVEEWSELRRAEERLRRSIM